MFSGFIYLGFLLNTRFKLNEKIHINLLRENSRYSQATGNCSCLLNDFNKNHNKYKLQKITLLQTFVEVKYKAMKNVLRIYSKLKM